MTGPELRAALKRLHMKQKEFALHTNFREETVSRWVRGHREVPKVIEIAVTGMLAQEVGDNG